MLGYKGKVILVFINFGWQIPKEDSFKFIAYLFPQIQNHPFCQWMTKSTGASDNALVLITKYSVTKYLKGMAIF